MYTQSFLFNFSKTFSYDILIGEFSCISPFSYRSHPDDFSPISTFFTFFLFLTLLPSLAHFFTSPSYRMLVLVLFHPFTLAFLLLSIEFCSSSFMHPIRPIARTSTSLPPPLSPDSLFPSFPMLPANFFQISHAPSISNDARLGAISYLTTYVALVRHLLVVRYVLLLLTTRAYP